MPKFCSDCFSGTLLADAKPSGTIETIAGIPSYVARPTDKQVEVDAPQTEPLGVIVILPDVFGWELPNTRVLADSYAQRIPAIVVIPDLFNGHAVPAKILSSMDRFNTRSSNWAKNIIAHIRWNLTIGFYCIPLLFSTRPSSYDPKLIRYLQTLRSLPLTASGSAVRLNRVGVAGFCHGGQATVRLSHGPASKYARKSRVLEPLVDCAFTAHPSMLSMPKDWEMVHQPLSVANGDVDMMMLRDQVHQAVMILEEGKDNCEFRVYPGAFHGFGTRANPADEKQKEYSMQAQDQAVRWFQRYLPDGE